jgi:acyl-CoA dehydrogenase
LRLSEFNEDQRQLRDAVSKFVKEEIIPKAGHYDKTMEYPWDLVKKSHANGFMNLCVPAAYGGLGMDLVGNVIVSEQIGYGCTGIGTALLANDLAATPLVIAANDDIKKRFLSRIIEEPIVVSYAVTEPGCGSDVAGAKTRAEKKGNLLTIN